MSDPDELLIPHQAGKVLIVSTKTLDRWRWEGKGPRFVKIGHGIRYRPLDLQSYSASRVFDSTSGYSAERKEAAAGH